MLRKVLIALHLAGAALSIALLVSTFVAKGLITSKARQVAVDKSRGVSDPLAAKLQETLDRPVLGKLTPATARERLEAELQSYRTSPEAWLLRLAEGGSDRAQDFEFPEIENPIARKAVDALVKGVSELKEHLEKSYRDLIVDLRIFAGTNILAFGVAAWLSWIARTPRSRHWLLAYSSLMLVVFVISITSYLDQNWTWTILTARYMGWGYPAAIGFLTLHGILRINPDLARSQPAGPDDFPKP
jgi:hypothetical protein